MTKEILMKLQFYQYLRYLKLLRHMQYKKLASIFINKNVFTFLNLKKIEMVTFNKIPKKRRHNI